MPASKLPGTHFRSDGPVRKLFRQSLTERGGLLE